MKILHCIYDHTGNPWVAGGGAVRAYELNRRLARKHDVTIVSGKYPSSMDYEEGSLKFRFVGTASNNYVLSTFSYAYQAARYIRAHRDDADVVVEDFAPYNPLFSFLTARKALLQLHQREGLTHLKKYFLLGVPFYLLERFYHKAFAYIIVLSEGIRKNFCVSGNAAIIPNGFDPALFYEPPEDQGFLLFLGRLHINQKGLDTLRDALTALNNDMRLVLAGGGKDKAQVKKLFNAVTAKGAIHFPGYVSGRQKIDYLKNCSIMVMPSRYEGQPLTLFEAAACGKPVVVSDIPELHFAVEAGFGVSFRTGDATDLAEKIDFLRNDTALRQKMGRKAREYAKDYTWDRIAEKYEEFLLRVRERD